MEVAVVIPVRLNSSRLWGKALLPYNGVPATKVILDRLTSNEWSTVLAISEAKHSSPLVHHAKIWDVDFVVGSHADVLSRVIKAASAVGADIVVRATADNPLLSARAVRKGLSVFRKTRHPCVCNLGHESCSDPEGFFVDIASLKALRHVHAETKSERLREHVTLDLKEKDRCRYFSVLSGEHSQISWTVDTPEQYVYMSNLLEDRGTNASAEDALEWSYNLLN